MSLTLQDLLQHPDNHLNQSVEVRGFLYRNDEGVFLSDIPNIRSCCLNKTEITKLFLKGEFPDPLPTQVAVVEGKVVFNEKPILVDARVGFNEYPIGSITFLGIAIIALFYLILKTCFRVKGQFHELA